MSSPTFNAGIDLFGLEAASSNKLKVKSSSENFTDSLAEAENGKGDVVAQDRYGEQAAPSADYDCVGAVTLSSLKLGTVSTPSGMPVPVMLTNLTFTTSAANPVSVSASGVSIESGGSTLRQYALPSITLSPRHRAQDILNALTVKIGQNAATETQAEITNATFAFSVTPTFAEPKGVRSASDCHGGKLEATYTVGCWVSTRPTFEAASGYTMSVSSKTDPENGYTTYTVTLSKPLTGADYTPPAQ